MRGSGFLFAATLSIATATVAAPPAITHVPVVNPPPGDVVIQAKIIAESKVFPQVFWRLRHGTYASPIDMSPVRNEKNVWFAIIPRKGNSEIEYYIEAYDEYGNGPARAGDAEAPIRVGGAASPAQAAAPAPASKR
jgi:hypothetical protein